MNVFLYMSLLSVACVRGGELPLERKWPSPVKYFKQPAVEIVVNSSELADSRSQEPRFGYPVAYGTDLQPISQGYSNGGISGVYSPLRIDLGGVILGTVLGLGAVLIVPKILNIFTPTHSYGTGYKRSLEESDFSTSISKFLSKFDEALTQNNIDTGMCVQRVVCTYVQTVNNTKVTDLFTTMNPVVNFLVDGSKFKAAVLLGRSGHSCNSAYPKCPFTKESISAGLQSLLSPNSI